MPKIIGGLTGMIVCAAIIIVGLASGAPAFDTLLRAALGLIAGYLVGWLVFGPLGEALVQETTPKTQALPEPKAPEAPKELTQ